MSIKKWFFDRFKGVKPQGGIEAPPGESVKPHYRIHESTRRYVDDISSALYKLSQLDSLLSAPKVSYIKGVHTKATMLPIEGLGIPVIIFNSESGEPLCAEIQGLDND